MAVSLSDSDVLLAEAAALIPISHANIYTHLEISVAHNPRCFAPDLSPDVITQSMSFHPNWPAARRRIRNAIIRRKSGVNRV
jgi:hypothetical protein